MTKLLQLSKGQYAIIDDEDFEWANQWKWSALEPRSEKKYYAHRGRKVNDPPGTRILLLHREIFNRTHGYYPTQVDHIDRNTLNNCRNNLRSCSNTQNLMNTGAPNVKKTSVYKGVRWASHANKWAAQLARTHLGYFTDEKEAALAYDRAVTLKFGKFAFTNFNAGVG